MANSLLTGISGLRGHQKMLEVIGNNRICDLPDAKAGCGRGLVPQQIRLRRRMYHCQQATNKNKGMSHVMLSIQLLKC